MKPFCEIVVQDVLPAIRALMAKELMIVHKLTQQEVATKLGVSQAAVSQYRRELRGFKVKILENDKTVIDSINDLTKRLATGELNNVTASEECCLICRAIRNKKLICELHMEAAPNFENCKMCLGN